jgi:lysophospholipase L1-like esterase
MPALQTLDPNSQDAADLRRVVNGGLRSLNLWAALGDSRVEQIHADTTNGSGPKLRRTTYNHANIGNALAGNRVRFLNFGVSGDRTDQVLARLPAAIASGAGVLYIHCGVNNIGLAPYTRADNGVQVTTANVGAVTLADITTMVNAGLAAGMVVVVTGDPGGTGITGGALNQLTILNTGLRALARTQRNVIYFDLPSVVRDPLGNLGGLTFRSGYYLVEGGIQTHEATPGAVAGGKLFASLIKELVPALNQHFVDATENATTSQLFYNPTLVQVDNNFPVGYAIQKTAGAGGATWTTSVAARADGRGNELTVNYTFASAGDSLRVFQDAPGGSVVAGDTLQIFSEYTVVAGSTGLAAVFPNIEANLNTGVFVTSGCASDAVHGAIPTTSDLVIQDATERMTVPAFASLNYISADAMRLVASGPGSGTVRLLMPAFRRNLP